MKVHTHVLLEECIERGVRQVIKNSDYVEVPHVDYVVNQITDEIWLQLDTYFHFEE